MARYAHRGGIGAELAAALSPLQEAFRRNHALQCGFCTAGILMSLDSYLRQNPIRPNTIFASLLSGHLCRCTGYTPIVAAAPPRKEQQERDVDA